MARRPALNEWAVIKLGSEKLARLVIDEAKLNTKTAPNALVKLRLPCNRSLIV
jgi:hypothetical protein